MDKKNSELIETENKIRFYISNNKIYTFVGDSILGQVALDPSMSSGALDLLNLKLTEEKEIKLLDR